MASVVSQEGSSPRHQASLAAYFTFPQNFSADGVLHYMSRLPAQDAPASWDLDARIAWRPTPTVQLSLVGQGLLAPHRFEYAGGESGNVDIKRAYYGKVTWQF